MIVEGHKIGLRRLRMLQITLLNFDDFSFQRLDALSDVGIHEPDYTARRRTLEADLPLTCASLAGDGPLFSRNHTIRQGLTARQERIRTRLEPKDPGFRRSLSAIRRGC